MALASGTRFGSHEIVGLLGAGGMGEVYRATDTRLNRDVALKALPDSVATDPDRVARFKREAQVLASLNHPNVAAIYGLEESAGGRALVMELVEGPTLADRLAQGPIAIDEALSIAKQIAEAIEYAHDQGVVHRDLKPANIKITPAGTVKVLDFGLAKALIDDPRSQLQANSPTLSLAATQAGLILGTAAYMSPEQAKGKPADRRADIWSFGIVLFEMFAGRPVYSGETVSETMAAVIMKDPDWASLPATTPPRLRELLRRCLVKDPRARLQAIGEARIALEDALHEPAGPISTSAAALSKRRGVSPRPLSRFAVPLPEGQQFTNVGRQVVAMSPDGNNLVFVANQRLYLRSLSDLEPRVIQGSDLGVGVLQPTLSPDGQAVAFYSTGDRTIKRLAISGGAAVTLCAAEAPFGMSWSEHGIIFGQSDKGILRVSPNGGTPQVIVTVSSDLMASSPHMLPNGRTVLFSIKNRDAGWDKGQIVVESLDSGARKTLVERGADGRYLPTGHLVYAVSGILLAVRFDVDDLMVSGEPVPVVEGVRRAGLIAGTGTAHFDYSATGTLAYWPGPVTADDAGNDLALFDRTGGGVQPLKLPPRQYRSPRVSPDGGFVVFDSEDDKAAIVWVYELSGTSAVRQLTFGGKNRAPIWSHDGQSVFFQSDREGDLAIYRQRADGSSAAERLTKADAGTAHWPQSATPDGARLLYSVTKGDPREASLWTMTMGDRRTQTLSGLQAREASLSPDGKWLAYNNVDGVFVEPFPRTGAKYLVPERGGHPYWSPKGDELLVNAAQTASAVVPFTTTPRVAFGRSVVSPRPARSEPNPSTGRRNVDMLPDGQHIIGVTTGLLPESQNASAPITVVLNWFDEVRQRVPR